MNFKKNIYFFTLFIFSFSFGQDDLFKELDTIKSDKKEIETAAFKALQIATMQSTKLPVKGDWYFLVAHRFGDLSNGFDNFFGFDNAFTKLGGIYGATNWLSLSLSRHTYNKTYEVGVKYKLANQEVDGFPVTIVGYNTIDINSELSKDIYPNLEFSQRMAYSTQLLISRKFSEIFSAQVASIYVHKNLYEATSDLKSTFLLGAGGRYKITKRMSINLEYAARLKVPKEDTLNSNPLTLGLDIETGGHVFQLVFSNSQPMNDISVFTNANGDWTKGKVYFGFNLYRVF